MREGDAAITIRSEAAVPLLAAGRHRVFFRNGHATADSVYLANTLMPENDQLAVMGQRRDEGQRELTIDLVVHGLAGAEKGRPDGKWLRADG